MWLFPWPISRALPRAFRIYYFGPAGEPPPGFYDYWGVSGFYWPDPDIPPDPNLFPDLPDDIFNPGDPVNPPDPGDFPDFPDGPSNPSDPYTPGPGPYIPGQPIPPAGWITALDDTYWKNEYNCTWNVDHWDFLGDFGVGIRVTGEWSRGYRPTKMRITHDYGAGLYLILANAGEPGWAYNDIVVSGTEYDLDFSGDSDADITILWHDAGEEGCDFDITNIEFYS